MHERLVVYCTEISRLALLHLVVKQPIETTCSFTLDLVSLYLNFKPFVIASSHFHDACSSWHFFALSLSLPES